MIFLLFVKSGGVFVTFDISNIFILYVCWGFFCLFNIHSFKNVAELTEALHSYTNNACIEGGNMKNNPCK